MISSAGEGHAMLCRREGWGGNQTGLNPGDAFELLFQGGSLGIQSVKEQGRKESIHSGQTPLQGRCSACPGEGQGLGSV